MIPVIASSILSIVDKFIPNTAEKMRIQAEIEKALIEQAGKQLDVNAEEAKHRSIFIAGWRPCVGWICALSFGYHFLLNPILVLILSMNGMDTGILPEFDMSSLLTVLMGMLGLGGLRTYEKKQGLTQ